MADLEESGTTCHAVGESGMEVLLERLKRCTTHEVDEVLDLLRAQQGEWTVPSMTNLACEVLLLLQHRCVKDPLSMGSLRRLTSLASEAFVDCGLVGTASGLADTAGQLLAYCIAVAPPVESYRMDNFQIFLEQFQQKAPRITSQAAGSVFAATLTKAVSAFCAPPLGSDASNLQDAAKTAARLSIVAVLSPALKQREESLRCFVEDMAAYLAAACLEVDAFSEAARLLLASLRGSLSLVLRSRRAPCDSKVACLKIIGRITRQLNAKDVEEELCESCQELQDPETKHHCRKGVEAAFYEESCDVCLLRWAASEMAALSTAKCVRVGQELWPARFLLMESWKQALEADLLRDAGRLLQLTLWAEEKLPAGAREVLKRGQEWLTGSKSAMLKVSQGWNPPEEALWRPLRRQQHGGALRLLQNLSTEVLAQLRSPQAHVRAAALRSLLPAVKGHHLHRLPNPKSMLEEILRKDPSASVRATAIPLISALGQDGNGNWDSWSLGLLRAAAAREDDAPTVRLGSCRVLAAALRHSVGTATLVNVAQICCEVAVHMNALWSHASAGGIVEDMQHFIFDNVESEGQGALLLEALSSAYRLGAEQLLPVTLKVLKKREAKYRSKVQALAKTLRDAFDHAGHAVSGAALEALSVAAPWALVEQVKALSSYLAMAIPPSADEEVRGLSILAVLGNALAEQTRSGLLSSWAWARLHELCSSQSSKLVRSAMRCVCLAAQAEDNLAPILRHLRPAMQVLRTQLEQAPGASSGCILRAAWLAACACEFCDLDLISPSELGLLAMPSDTVCSGRTRGVGTSIAKDLLRLFQVFQATEVRSPLPTLVMAVGFALRRHWHLVGSTDFDHVVSFALAEGGDTLLAERSLEVLASLCEHLSRQAEEGEAGNCAVVLSKFTRHLPAVLRFLQHGLQRRAAPGDAGLRGHAMRAARALHRAGVGGNPAVLCATAMTSVFDPSLHPGAQLLLMSLAQKDSQALAQAQNVGLRKAFSALLWQAPQKLAPSSKNPALARAAENVGKSFAVCGRVARGKWLRLLLGELTCHFVESNYEALPEQLTPSRRLSAFGGSPVKDWTDQWPRLARLQLLYSHFLAQILCALPVSMVAPTTGQSEMELIKQECQKFLDLRCAVAASALEHEGSLSDASMATCIISMVIKALLVSLNHAEALERSSALAVELALHRTWLDKVAKGDVEMVEQWLHEAQGTNVIKKSPKKRRAPVMRGRIEKPKKQRRNADGKAS